MNKNKIEATVSMLGRGSFLVLLLGIVGAFFAVIATVQAEHDYYIGVGLGVAALILVLAVFFSYMLRYFAAALEIKANKD